MTEAEVRAALNTVIDPCSAVAGAPAGIVEMGLVRDLAIVDEGAGVAVCLSIGVTEPGCMMGASFASSARERLEALPGISSVDVQLDHKMDWSPGDLDPGYAARLAQVRQAKRDEMRARGLGI
ncbi:MAG: iron-sulfur cluster assembly protein [Actinomycetota bacterium]|nr:iron-sulfur cluster assembly protein [Actinomycetota bacterium]